MDTVVVSVRGRRWRVVMGTVVVMLAIVVVGDGVGGEGGMCMGGMGVGVGGALMVVSMRLRDCI